MAETSLGISAVRQGDWGAAELFLRRAVALWTSLGAHESEHTASFAYLALAFARSGRMAEARENADRAVATSGCSRSAEALAHSVLAELELREERFSQALAASERAMAVIHSHHLFEEVGLARVAHVQSLRACGRTQEAEQALKDATLWLHERAQRIGDPAYRVLFLTQIPEHAALFALAQDMGQVVR